MTIKVIRQSRQYVSRGETPPPPVTITVQTPEHSRCHWDAPTRTLIVKNTGGDALAVFTDVFTFYVDGVSIEP